jgi:hypothetical protein
LWEAFLLQMNDFDKVLELQLRHMLDPVVATRPPARGERPKKTRKPILVVRAAAIELVADAIPMVEPVAVTVPVAGTQL